MRVLTGTGTYFADFSEQRSAALGVLAPDGPTGPTYWPVGLHETAREVLNFIQPIQQDDHSGQVIQGLDQLENLAQGEPAMANMSTFFQYPELEPEVDEPTFLESFSDQDLHEIYSIGEVQLFEAGEIMVTEWANDSALFIILQGTAEVLLPKRNGWHKLESLSPAGVFGELSFFDRQPRSARVVVLTDCKVLKISENAFQNLRMHDTGLALRLVQDLGRILSYRMRKMNDLVRTLAN